VVWEGTDCVPQIMRPQFRISLALLFSVLGTVALAVVAYVALDRVQARYNVAISDGTNKLIDVQDLSRAFEENMAQGRGYLITGNQFILSEAATARQRFLTLASKFEVAAVDDKREAALLKAIMEGEAAHQTALMKLVEARQISGLSSSLARSFELEIRPHRVAVKDALLDLISYEKEKTSRALNSVSESVAFQRGLVLSAGVLGILFALGVAFHLMRTAKKLGLTEERFLDLVNHLDHSVVWEADAYPLKFNFVSERIQFLLGYSPRDVENDPEVYFSFIHDDDRKKVRDAMQRAHLEKSDQRVEHRIYSSDGEELWVQTGIHGKRNSEGQDQLYGITMDVTPYKQSSLEVERLREKVRLTLESASVGTFEQNLQTGEIELSPIAAELCGFEKGTIRVSTDAVMERVHPEDRAQIKEGIASANPNTPTYGFEFRVNLPDGRTRWIMLRGKFEFDRSGKPLLLRGVKHDISELRESQERARLSEARYKHRVDSIPAIIWEADHEGRVLELNDYWFKLTGASRPAITLKGQWAEYFHPDDKEQASAKLDAIRKEGRPGRLDARIRMKDGSYSWFELHLVPKDFSEGTIPGWYGAGIEIDERVELVNRLHEEQESRERFVNMLTHDLRTPLATAKMGGQMILKKLGNPQMLPPIAERVVDSVNRMERMIQDLLDTSRIRAGEALSLKLVSCDLKSVISQTLEDLSTVHGDRFEFIPRDEISGKFDCEGIRRVIENLATNAVKYGTPDTPIVVELYRHLNSAEILVRNKGEPLSDAEISRLFQQFARTASAEKSGKAGWGIGLTLVKGIVESHGGEVRAKSENGETTFIVCIPVNSTGLSRHEHPASQFH
jgi:PAS domain S-box-containing protein